MASKSTPKFWRISPPRGYPDFALPCHGVVAHGSPVRGESRRWSCRWESQTVTCGGFEKANGERSSLVRWWTPLSPFLLRVEEGGGSLRDCRETPAGLCAKQAAEPLVSLRWQ